MENNIENQQTSQNQNPVAAVVYQYPQSGPFRRVFSCLIDLVLVSIIWLICGSEAFGVSGSWNYSSGALTSHIVFFNPLNAFYLLLIFIAYSTVLESIFQKTLGQFLTGQKVVNENKQKPGFVKVLVRNIFKIVDMIVSVPVFLFSKKNQVLGDMVAKTFVIRKKLLDLNIIAVNRSIARKIFAWLFTIFLVSMLVLTAISIPKIKALNAAGISIIKDVQTQVQTGDIDGFYHSFVSEYQATISLEEFRKNILGSDFQILTKDLNPSDIHFYAWEFVDGEARLQGTERESKIKLHILRDEQGVWKIMTVSITDPSVTKARN